MREDIYGALINAIERGSSLEQAVNSLVNSGYNVNEVREAASHIASGSKATSSIMELSRPQTSRPLISPENSDAFKQLPRDSAPRSRGNGKIIILILILLILLGALIATLLFRQQVIEFISGFIS